VGGKEYRRETMEERNGVLNVGRNRMGREIWEREGLVRGKVGVLCN